MKTKILLVATLIGLASMSARAGVHFGFSFGLPLVVSAPVYAAPAPVVVAAPVCAPVYAAAPGYVWYPGYWSVGIGGRAWVPGGWRYGHGYYGHGYYGHGWGHGGGRR
jgi:hypothetical protein